MLELFKKLTRQIKGLEFKLTAVKQAKVSSSHLSKFFKSNLPFLLALNCQFEAEVDEKC
jgi:hypothetical protein